MSIAGAASLTLTCGPTAPGDARRFARRAGAASDRTLDTIELLVSELVTNAVVHAHGDVELTIHDLGGRVRVEVRDTSAYPPTIRQPDPTGGRGLHIVDALATRWGIEAHVSDGKTVWFEV